MSLKKPQPEAKPEKAATCDVCGAACIDMQVNQATLCDPHFDGWLAFDRNPNVGGQVDMARFVAESKAKRAA